MGVVGYVVITQVDHVGCDVSWRYLGFQENRDPSCAIRLKTSKKFANLGFEKKFGYNSAFWKFSINSKQFAKQFVILKVFIDSMLSLSSGSTN